MSKQQVIPGTESTRHSQIDEAIEALRLARQDLLEASKSCACKAARERVMAASATLATAMLDVETPCYESHANGERWRADLEMPEPSVKLKYIGKEDE